MSEKKKGESWYVIKVQCPYCKKSITLETWIVLDNLKCFKCLKEFEVEKPEKESLILMEEEPWIYSRVLKKCFENFGNVTLDDAMERMRIAIKGTE